MTLDELNQNLPNGFHDAKLFSIQLDYVAGTAVLHLSLHVGRPEDPESERERYQEATLNLNGLCFCSIEPPDPRYHFLPNGKPTPASGDPAKADHLPSLPALSEQLPQDAWCYRFFLDNWNAFIHVAARNAEIRWIGTKPSYI